MGSRFVTALKAHRSSLPWVMVRKLLARLVQLETLVLFARDLRTCTSMTRRVDPDLRLLPVDDPQQSFFERLCQQHPERNFAERLLRPGQQCFVALRKDSVAGYAWATLADVHLEEIAHTYVVPSDEIFIYDCFVEPQHRGAGVYPAMLECILETSCRAGKLKTACIAASSVNRASIKGILKAGFVETRRIRYIKYRQTQRWWGLTPTGPVQARV